MASYRTGFTIEHGFAFANWFTFDLSVTPLLRLGRISPGLCGGMAYAALDYYHAGAPIPIQTTPPQQKTPLCRYLIERQVASNSVALVAQVARWTVRDAAKLQARMLAQELPALRARLQRNEPAVLVLVRANALGQITHNHQVVACGYDEDQYSGQMSIAIYDPNWPRQPLNLSLELHAPSGGLVPWHEADGGFKGFFLQSYMPRQRGLPIIL